MDNAAPPPGIPVVVSEVMLGAWLFSFADGTRPHSESIGHHRASMARCSRLIRRAVKSLPASHRPDHSGTRAAGPPPATHRQPQEDASELLATTVTAPSTSS